MNTKMKRLLSIVLTAVMVFALLPASKLPVLANTTEPETLTYNFNLLSFNYTAGSYIRLFNGHNITADATTYLQDANYTYHNGNGGKWRLAEGAGNGYGSWMLSAYLYNNATDSLIMEAYTSNRFAAGGSRPFISFKVQIPTAGTYSVDVVTGKTSTINYHFYMFEAAGVTSTLYADLCNAANEIGTLDSTLYTSGTMSEFITVDEPGEYYFVMKADNDLATSNVSAEKVSMHLKTLTLTPVPFDEPVINGGTSINTNSSTTLYVTQTREGLDTPVTISNVTYSVTSGSDKVRLAANNDGSVKVSGVGVGTATVKASFVGADGKTYEKTVDITVSKSNTVTYNFNLLSFDYTAGSYIRLFNGHNVTADAVTYLQDANYTYHNGNGALWRLAEGAGSGYGSWILSAYLYNNANDSLIMESYTANRFAAGGSRPFVSFKVYIPAAGTYSVDVVTGKTSTINYHFYMFEAAGVTSTLYADLCNAANEIGTLDSTLYTSGTMSEFITVDEPGEYYFVMKADNDLATSNVSAEKVSMHLKSLTLKEVNFEEPVINGGTSVETTKSTTLYITQDNDVQDTPATISDVVYSIINGGDKVTLQTNNDGSATVYGISAGTATLQATFTGIDGKQYTKTVDITVTGRSILNYYFNLTSFDYTGSHLRLFNLHTVQADAVTYLQNADYTYHNGNGGKWRLAEGAGDHIGSWILSAYIYDNATDSLITEAYTNNRFTEASDRPFISFKVYIPAAGSYSVEVVTGRTSTVNYHFYMFDPADASGLSYAELCDKANEIGTLDSTKYSSAAMGKYITVDEPGEYYFVMSADNDLNTVDFTAEKVTMQLKSLTLKPVELEESELSKAEVTGKSAALGDGITMTLPYKAPGSSVKYINVYVAGKLYQTLPAGASGEINVDIYPRQLTDLIELYAADGNGLDLAAEPFYSITLYAYLTQLIDAPAYAGYHDLARSLITYCVEAQTYFGYGEVPTDFADYAMSALQTPEAHSGRKPVGGTAVDGIKAKSATLILQDKLGIRFYFAVESGYDIANYVFTYGDTELTPVKEGSRYYVEVHDIMPYTYDEDVVIAVNDSLTVTYSPMDYIQKKYATGDADLQGVVKALYTYYKEAFDFKTANG